MSNGALQEFAGIDLAWSIDKKHTGIAILYGNEKGATLTSCLGVTGLAEIVECVCSSTGSNTVVAIDAPLIITNETRSRPVDIAISRRFGKYHAGAHSVNKLFIQMQAAYG